MIVRGSQQHKVNRVGKLTVLATAFLFCVALHVIIFLPLQELPPMSPETRPPKFCDHHPCIFDLGHNNGQDTYYYLSNSDAHVLAVEANPLLIRQSQNKFRSEIATGRLRLLPMGLSEVRDAPTLTFWINTVDDKFSSFSKELGCRGQNRDGQKITSDTFCKAVRVPTTTCDRLIHEYGTPDYMKIDIEGRDGSCIHSLWHVMPEQRPRYLSVENVSQKVIETLVLLGYKYFKVVEQSGLQVGIPKHLDGYSGPWGEEAIDIETGRMWRLRSEVPSRESLPKKISVNGKARSAWYDLHARM